MANQLWRLRETLGDYLQIEKGFEGKKLTTIGSAKVSSEELLLS